MHRGSGSRKDRILSLFLRIKLPEGYKRNVATRISQDCNEFRDMLHWKKYTKADPKKPHEIDEKRGLLRSSQLTPHHLL